MKGNADFEIASEQKLICFRLHSSFLLSSLRINYFGLKLVCAIIKENLLLIDFCAVMKVMSFLKNQMFKLDTSDISREFTTANLYH